MNEMLHVPPGVLETPEAARRVLNNPNIYIEDDYDNPEQNAFFDETAKLSRRGRIMPKPIRVKLDFEKFSPMIEEGIKRSRLVLDTPTKLVACNVWWCYHFLMIPMKSLPVKPADKVVEKYGDMTLYEYLCYMMDVNSQTFGLKMCERFLKFYAPHGVCNCTQSLPKSDEVSKKL